MNVGKIQRLSETHENLEMFLRVCLLNSLLFTVEGQGHSKSIKGNAIELILPCLRESIRASLRGLESQIEKEVQDGKG